MEKLNIHGYGDDLTINNIKIGDLTPSEHEKIELEKGGQNYSPLENVVVSHVKDSSTLICRKPSKSDVKNSGSFGFSRCIELTLSLINLKLLQLTIISSTKPEIISVFFSASFLIATLIP